MKRALLILCLLVSTLGLQAAEGSLDERFVAANQAYDDGQYEQAINGYTQLLEESPSATVYYNLGNAYYLSGQYGQAILQYQRCLVLSPDNADAQANLKLAQDAAQVDPPERVWYETYAQSTSVNCWTWLAVAGFWGAAFLIILPPLYGWRSPWRALLLALCILGGGAGVAGLTGYHFMSAEGIVLADDAPLQLAPTSTSPAKTFLHAGTSATVKQIHGEYAYVVTPTGDQGWISQKVFGKIWDMR
ncbi:tetratricopeptide repeat protein [Ruficoccus amylovorans]|uniref:Tetratricopeptide repeat protein n=1 Tax=Ruficoccus amylovorans TaxID=1804625 RepID=A0A842H990_9BACT|nr:tetratricopeptide repeat protein [Ruficoccus amylovorans]MBC2592890.1 tetratricopeptide repeat protein [Ruficoccus amylovorans]